MFRLLPLAFLPALLAFAPAPFEDPDPEPDPRPEKALERFDKAVRAPKAKEETLEKMRKSLVEKLMKAAADLEKRGKTDAALKANDYGVLLESLKPDAHLGKATGPELLKTASVKGKYKKLLHVLHMPGDLASYTEFRDYGTWGGSSYGGHNMLKPGYWVYVHPRWFIWEKAP